MKQSGLLAPVSWPRMIRGVEKVRDRMLRTAEALQTANIPYAVAGGNAVAAWVSRVDEAAVRNTRDVDILLRRSDLPAARRALEAAGFIYRRLSSLAVRELWTCFSMDQTPAPKTLFIWFSRRRRFILIVQPLRRM